FKYYGFAATNINALTGTFGTQLIPVYQILLPIGISFHIFESIGYLTDVYRGRMAPEREPSAILLFLTFFPKLVAGPIERAGHLIPQLAELRQGGLRRADVAGGLFMILQGAFLKVVVADNLAR